jgi:TonB family protein
MSRLESKCFVGSVTMHLLLLTILMVGPGLLGTRPSPNDKLPVLEMIPSRLIDAPFMGGGSPRPTTLLPAPAPAIAAPQATPKNQVLSPAAKPEPTPHAKDTWLLPDQKRKKQPKTEASKAESPDNAKTGSGKHEIVPNLRRQVRNPAGSPAPNARPNGVDGARARAEAHRAVLNEAVSELRGGLAGATEVGVGGGGPAYASYWQALKTIYTDAWTPPEDLTDDIAKVRAEITVARNGRVISARIVPGGRSGIPSLDRSVQEALDRVRDVPPFPEEAEDNERTFKLLFDPKLKRGLG